MAILPIVKLGEDVLREKSTPVEKVTKKVQKLVKDMIDTMYEADGVGLAAPQIGVLQRILVIDVGEGPFAVINPEIIEMQGEEIDVEGCLSIPDVRGYVKRAEKIIVTGIDEKGKNIKITATGLLSRAFQHEIDHLDGVLFIDRMIKEEQES